jgi:acetyltransferase-like isoleucine patch superfamily enzyme
MEKTSGTPVSFIFRNTHILPEATIKSGAIIMPGSVVSTNVTLGEFTHVNFNSYVAHDCKIGNFVTISPNVTCCGNTFIGDGVLIGASSSIKQGQPDKPRLIGRNSILGIGSVLISDIPEDKTFIGNPARERN